MCLFTTNLIYLLLVFIYTFSLVLSNQYVYVFLCCVFDE